MPRRLISEQSPGATIRDQEHHRYHVRNQAIRRSAPEPLTRLVLKYSGRSATNCGDYKARFQNIDMEVVPAQTFSPGTCPGDCFSLTVMLIALKLHARKQTASTAWAILFAEQSEHKRFNLREIDTNASPEATDGGIEVRASLSC